MVSDALEIVGYRRVSTEDQADRGSSLEAQTEKISSYLRARGFRLVEMVDDGGESAKSLDRPGIQRCIWMLRNGQAHGLCVANVDRLTRHVGDLVGLVESVFMEPGGPILLSASEMVETRSAAGRAFLYMMGLFGQYMREAGVERTAGVMTRKRELKERTGNLRFGMKVDPSDPRRSKKSDRPNALISSPEDREIESLILDLRSRKLSLKSIAEELNDRGIPGKRGVTKTSTGRWAKSSVHEIIKRAEARERGDYAQT